MTMSGMLAIECSLPQLLCFSHHFFGGSFVSKPFFQPPSIRPISPSFRVSSECLSVGTSLLSQASWIKNLSTSILDIAFASTRILGSSGRYADWKVSSRTERKFCSILLPIPSLSTFGKFL